MSSMSEACATFIQLKSHTCNLVFLKRVVGGLKKKDVNDVGIFFTKIKFRSQKYNGIQRQVKLRCISHINDIFHV